MKYMTDMTPKYTGGAILFKNLSAVVSCASSTSKTVLDIMCISIYTKSIQINAYI